MSKKFNVVLLSNLSYFEQISMQINVYRFLFGLNFEYPKFSDWYHRLFLENGALKPNREILICMDGALIIGVAILKKDFSENKICTLRVANKYQNLGIGRALMEKSFEYLEEEKPLITIHISKYNDFKKIFDRYGFTIEQEKLSYYGFLKSEIIYNGILNNFESENNISLSQKISYDLERMLYNYSGSEKKLILLNQKLDLNPVKQV